MARTRINSSLRSTTTRSTRKLLPTLNLQISKQRFYSRHRDEGLAETGWRDEREAKRVRYAHRDHVCDSRKRLHILGHNERSQSDCDAGFARRRRSFLKFADPR